MLVSTSSNFAFLEDREPELYELATVAETHVYQSPTTALRELRTFGEVLVQRISDERAAHVAASTQHDRLVELKERGHLPERIASCLHQIRMRGNDASHENAGTQARAKVQLQNAWTAAVWYYEQFHSAEAMQATFTLPSPSDSDPDVQSELEQLRSRLETIAGRQAESDEVERLKKRIAELETGSKDHLPDSSSSNTASRNSFADKTGQTLKSVWSEVRSVGRQGANGLRALMRKLRQGITLVWRGIRSVLKWVVLLSVLSAFLLYFPSVYGTSVGLLSDETRQSFPAVDTVAERHAQVISTQTRAKIESTAADVIETVQQEGADAFRDLKLELLEEWNRTQEEEASH